MPDKIYLPPEESGASVIKIGDDCYEIQGDSDNAPTVGSAEEEFSSCEECDGLPPCSNSVSASDDRDPNSQTWCFSDTTRVTNFESEVERTDGGYFTSPGIGQWNRRVESQNGESSGPGVVTFGPGRHGVLFSTVPVLKTWYKDGAEVFSESTQSSFGRPRWLYDGSSWGWEWCNTNVSCTTNSFCDGMTGTEQVSNRATSLSLKLIGNGCCHDGMGCTEGSADCETGECGNTGGLP